MHLNVALKFLPVLLIAGKSGLIGLQFPQVRFQGLLNDGDVFRERGNFFVERGDFLV